MNQNELTFWEHVEELRKILIRAFIIVSFGFAVSLLFYSEIFSLLSALLPNDYSEGFQNPQLLILSPTEGLMTTFKLSFWVALIGTSPFWLYQFLSFITPALTKEEKICLIPFFFFSILFFWMGILFCYKVTLPFSNSYLNMFNHKIGLNYWSLSHYVDYTLILLLGNGLAFEGISLLFCLVHWGVISPATLKDKRRYFILFSFILGALLTPPDIFTQCLLALPLIGCYELAIVYSYIRKSIKKNFINN